MSNCGFSLIESGEKLLDSSLSEDPLFLKVEDDFYDAWLRSGTLT